MQLNVGPHSTSNSNVRLQTATSSVKVYKSALKGNKNPTTIETSKLPNDTVTRFFERKNQLLSSRKENTLTMSTSRDAAQTGTKRRAENQLVDPDSGVTITSSKKMTAEVDPERKVQVLKFIITAFQTIYSTILGSSTSHIFNITFGNQITNIIFAAHYILRQQASGRTGNQEAKASKDFKLTSMGKSYSVSIENALKLTKEAAESVGLSYKGFGPNDKENWYGTAGPYLDLFTGFKLRLDELRLGHSRMPIKTEKGQSSFPVIKYGLVGSHHLLLEGCTFPPEKRSSMAQLLGPMTTLLCHIRSEAKFRQKWTDAAKKSMSHIPYIDEILNAVKDRPSVEISSLIRILADILLFTPSRQTQIMFFPLNTLVYWYSLKTSPAGRILDDKEQETNWVGGDELLKGIKMSGGVGGYYFYKLVCQQEWIMEGDMSENEAAQIFFHSVFGTYKEDLTILEQITNIGHWLRKEEMKTCFQKATTCEKMRKFLPPALKYYSQVTSANQTGLLTSTDTQISVIPVFSGYRRQRFVDDFFEQIGKKTGLYQGGIKNMPELIATLSKTLEDVRKIVLDKGKLLEMGTINWFSMDNIQLTAPGTQLHVQFEGGYKFFLGRNS